MAIRFECSNCQNPIEVDDDFANQQATCPYCRAVVRVPTSSTLEIQRPVAARPISPESGNTPSSTGVPPLPTGYQPYRDGAIAEDSPQLIRARRWGWAALICGILQLTIFAVTAIAATMFIMDRLPQGFTPTIGQELTEEQLEVMTEAQEAFAREPIAMIGSVASVGLLLLTLVLGLISIVQHKNWQAITALCLASAAMLCVCGSIVPNLF